MAEQAKPQITGDRSRDVIDVACPTCGSSPGELCYYAAMGLYPMPHRLRVQAWAELSPAPATVDRGDRWAHPPRGCPKQCSEGHTYGPGCETRVG